MIRDLIKRAKSTPATPTMKAHAAALVTAALAAIFGKKIGSGTAADVGKLATTFLLGLAALYKSPPPKHRHHPHRGPKPPFRMADAVTVASVPDGLPAYAAYVNGRYANYIAMKNAHPSAKLLGIAVNTSVLTNCLDVEPGDAAPAEAAAWVQRAHDAGHTRPCLYSDRADFPAVIASIRAAGIPRTAVRYWVAHPDGVPHICTPERCGVPIPPDATQYLFAGGYDESLCLGDFLDAQAHA